MLDPDAPFHDRRADGVGVRWRVDERVRGAQLAQPVHVAVADHRLAAARGPALGEAVEIQPANEHRVELDRVEQIRVAIEIAPQTAGRRKEGVRRDDDPCTLPLQAREIVEGLDLLGAAIEIQQENVFAGDGALDAGDEDDSALGGVRGERPEVELPFVQGDGQRVVPEGGGAIDEVVRGMRNPVDRIV